VSDPKHSEQKGIRLKHVLAERQLLVQDNCAEWEARKQAKLGWRFGMNGHGSGQYYMDPQHMRELGVWLVSLADAIEQEAAQNGEG